MCCWFFFFFFFSFISYLYLHKDGCDTGAPEAVGPPVRWNGIIKEKRQKTSLVAKLWEKENVWFSRDSVFSSAIRIQWRRWVWCVCAWLSEWHNETGTWLYDRGLLMLRCLCCAGQLSKMASLDGQSIAGMISCSVCDEKDPTHTGWLRDMKVNRSEFDSYRA